MKKTDTLQKAVAETMAMTRRLLFERAFTNYGMQAPQRTDEEIATALKHAAEVQDEDFWGEEDPLN